MLRTTQTYRVGEPVVYRALKRSLHPSPRAISVRPETAGEGYQYEIDKFWAVSEIRDKQLVLLTRRGKLRTIDADDPSLRRAGWWDRLFHRNLFPTVGPQLAEGKSTT